MKFPVQQVQPRFEPSEQVMDPSDFPFSPAWRHVSSWPLYSALLLPALLGRPS